MAVFEPAVDKLLELEGGYANHPLDSGGPTNFGISFRFLKDHVLEKEFFKTLRIGSVPNFCHEDMENLPESDAKNIYQVFWWDRYGYQKLANQGVATAVFSSAVNMGPDKAHKLLQESCNQVYSFYPVIRLSIDGILGTKSFGSFNLANPDDLLEEYRLALKTYYRNIVKDDESQKCFLKGWLNRVDEL